MKRPRLPRFSSISLTLWHGLHHALPRHPLLGSMSRLERRAHNPGLAPAPFRAGALHGWTPLLGVLIALQVGIVARRPEVLLLPIGLIAGLMTTVGISGRISQECEQGRYTLLGLTPSGWLGASWALATRYVGRDLTWTGLRQLIDRFHLLWLFVLFPVAGVAGLMLFTGSLRYRGPVAPLYDVLLLPLNGAALLLISRADFQYATLAGALIGIIAPTYAPKRPESALLAVALFLVARSTGYALTLALGLPLVSGLGQSFAGPYAGALATLGALATYLSIQEIALIALCRGVAARLNTTLSEVVGIYRESI